MLRNNKRDILKHPKLQERNRPYPQAAISITEATVSGSVLSLTFNQAVSVKGIPNITTDVEGATPVSAVSTSPTSVDITYSASVDAATEINIPYQDPWIRNGQGGFVYSPTFQIAA